MWIYSAKNIAKIHDMYANCLVCCETQPKNTFSSIMDTILEIDWTKGSIDMNLKHLFIAMTCHILYFPISAWPYLYQNEIDMDKSSPQTFPGNDYQWLRRYSKKIWKSSWQICQFVMIPMNAKPPGGWRSEGGEEKNNEATGE